MDPVTTPATKLSSEAKRQNFSSQAHHISNKCKTLLIQFTYHCLISIDTLVERLSTEEV
jgi:hypothetical protein